MARRQEVGKNSRPEIQLSSAVIRSIFIVSSFGVLACALVGIGITCHLVHPDDGPCPANLGAIVYGIAGGLLVIGGVLLTRICCQRPRKDPRSKVAKGTIASSDLKNGVVASTEGFCPSTTEAGDDITEVKTCLEVGEPDTNNIEGGNNAGEFRVNVEVDNFAMTQKSADVSYWIEQQDVASAECCPLETSKASKCEETDNKCLESEVTAL